MSASVTTRGSDAVKAALIEAACDGLAEVGPRALSTRSLAERAGVNHGQIHHYFGGKNELLKAAMARLAAEHWQNTLDRTGGDPFPPPLALAEDSRYWRATARAAMEGQLDLVRVEIDQGLSVPRHALEVAGERLGVSADDLDFKADMALMIVSQLGYVAFEPFALLVADIRADDREAFREKIKQRMEKLGESLRPR